MIQQAIMEVVYSLLVIQCYWPSNQKKSESFGMDFFFNILKMQMECKGGFHKDGMSSYLFFFINLIMIPKNVGVLLINMLRKIQITSRTCMRFPARQGSALSGHDEGNTIITDMP